MSVKQTAELSGAIWIKGRSVPQYYMDWALMASEGQKSVNLSSGNAGKD